MWLPLTSRVGLGAFSPTTPRMTSDTHGPAALTSARAVISKRARLRWSSSVQPPDALVAPGRDEAGARRDVGAAVGSVAGVEHDQPRIVDPAVRILEGAAVLGLERLAGLVLA